MTSPQDHRSSGDDTPVLHDELAEFLDRIDRTAVVDQLFARIGGRRADVEDRLERYLTESFTGLRLIEHHLRPHDRILEVGSGLGVLSAFLAAKGYDVTAIEPGGTGYGFMPLAKDALDAQWGGCPYRFRPLSVDALSASEGRYEFAFSSNVLEHVPNVERALRSVHGVLSEQGLSRHTCPNYTVPFEPHFGLPLLPFAPSKTSAILPARVTSTELWDSLNFVTARQVREIARRAELDLEFDQDVMATTVRRLTEDDGFAARHPQLGRIARVVGENRGVNWALDRCPPALATPMTFTLRTRRAHARTRDCDHG